MKRIKTPFTLLFFVLLLIISTFSSAQISLSKDTISSVSMMEIHYSFLSPGGDLKTRFGNCINLGIGFQRKTLKNYLWGIEVNYLSGADVKEKYILDSLKTYRGQFISTEGRYGDVRVFERGLSFYGNVGKIIPVFGSNKNSGIMILAGIGFLQHKIHIEVLEENVPALNGDYRKGYDRLTNGLSLHQFIGYSYMQPKLRYSFNVGLDFSQSFTKNRRDWDFFEQRKLDEQRTDYLNGVKVSLIIPISKREPKEYYYR